MKGLRKLIIMTTLAKTPNNFYDEKEFKKISKLISNFEDNLIGTFLGEWLQSKGMQNILLARPSFLTKDDRNRSKKLKVINILLSIK